MVKNKTTTFLDRVKEQEEYSKAKKEKLIEKIKNERIKKKEEIDKPLEFDIKPKEMDKKFKKFYDEMRKKEEDIKKRLNIYAELVEKYKMKECKFQPNINENEDKKKKKKGLIQVIL